MPVISHPYGRSTLQPVPTGVVAFEAITFLSTGEETFAAPVQAVVPDAGGAGNMSVTLAAGWHRVTHDQSMAGWIIPHRFRGKQPVILVGAADAALIDLESRETAGDARLGMAGGGLDDSGVAALVENASSATGAAVRAAGGGLTESAVAAAVADAANPIGAAVRTAAPGATAANLAPIAHTGAFRDSWAGETTYAAGDVVRNPQGLLVAAGGGGGRARRTRRPATSTCGGGLRCPSPSSPRPRASRSRASRGPRPLSRREPGRCWWTTLTLSRAIRSPSSTGPSGTRGSRRSRSTRT